jgi:cysteine-rich repeat protein
MRSEVRPFPLFGSSWGVLLLRTAVAAVVLALGQIPTPAFGLDLTGSWTILFNPVSVTCQSQIVQSGTGTLSIHGSCSLSGSPGTITLTGTVDPSTGSFQAQGSASVGPCTALAITGAASSDGNSMSGNWTCNQSPFGDFSGTRGICGDGVLDPGEQCDDGNTVAGDGCSSTCQIEACNTCSGQPSICTPIAAGTACDDHNACTQPDQCDGNGACVGSNPVVCTASDRCHLAGTCDPTAGTCSNPPVVCTPVDQCHVAGTCDPATG